MTTQPEPAVGTGEPNAPEPTLEDRLFSAMEEQQEDETPEQSEEAPEAEGEQPEAAEDDVEIEPEDLPAIEPPVSWDAEAKERFAKLPREDQEYLSKREGERERFVQQKSQEAAQARQTAAAEAAQYVSQLQSQVAEQLEQYAQQLTVQEPDPSLIVSDPATYAQQLRAYQYFSAQREQAQREADKARADAEQHQALVREHEANAFRQHLTSELPEFFDETKGPQLKEQLTATAKFLGFSDQEIHNATSGQIIALKKISDLQAKAQKYDKLMARQMEKVREGKGKQLPPVSKPGVARGPDAQRSAQYAADREAMKHGDKDATSRVLGAILNSK